MYGVPLYDRLDKYGAQQRLSCAFIGTSFELECETRLRQDTSITFKMRQHYVGHGWLWLENTLFGDTVACQHNHYARVTGVWGRKMGWTEIMEENLRLGIVILRAEYLVQFYYHDSKCTNSSVRGLT